MTQLQKLNDNWFYYWKISYSLWGDKLASLPFNIIFVPIYWGFHSEKPGQYDFGNKRLEGNLKKISELGIERQKKIIFLVPTGPCPIFPNGGLPLFLTGNLSQNIQGHAFAVLTKEKLYNKIYSFFDTDVFNEYSHFIKSLGLYLENNKINCDLYGFDSGYYCASNFESYFNDRSNTFHKSFAKYIEASMEEDVFKGIKTPQEELEEINRFTAFIHSLYKKTAMNDLRKNWEGEIKIAFLGGSTKDFIRIGLSGDPKDYFNDLVLSVYQNFLPAVGLLECSPESNLFEKEFNDLITNLYIPWKFGHSFMDDMEFTPLSFFEIYDYAENFRSNDLLSYLDEAFGNTYSYFAGEVDQFPSFSNNEIIYFIPGSKIDRNEFQKILKFFLNGGKIFIDCQNLAVEIKNKLDTFLLENSLRVEKIKFYVNFEHISLGEGRLFLIQGEDFMETNPSMRREFWQKSLEILEIPHLHIDPLSNLYFFWKTRLASANEANYQEIRRLFIYNHHKQKKKIKSSKFKNMSLIRANPKIERNIENKEKIEIEVPAEGWVELEFGVWA